MKHIKVKRNLLPIFNDGHKLLSSIYKNNCKTIKILWTRLILLFSLMVVLKCDISSTYLLCLLNHTFLNLLLILQKECKSPMNEYNICNRHNYLYHLKLVLNMNKEVINELCRLHLATKICLCTVFSIQQITSIHLYQFIHLYFVHYYS